MQLVLAMVVLVMEADVTITDGGGRLCHMHCTWKVMGFGSEESSVMVLLMVKMEVVLHRVVDSYGSNVSEQQ